MPWSEIIYCLIIEEKLQGAILVLILFNTFSELLSNHWFGNLITTMGFPELCLIKRRRNQEVGAGGRRRGEGGGGWGEGQGRARENALSLFAAVYTIYNFIQCPVHSNITSPPQPAQNTPLPWALSGREFSEKLPALFYLIFLYLPIEGCSGVTW